MKVPSVLEIKVPPHEHEVTIFDSYELHAVCNICGMHDWAYDGESVVDFQLKYPKNKVIDINDNI